MPMGQATRESDPGMVEWSEDSLAAALDRLTLDVNANGLANGFLSLTKFS